MEFFYSKSNASGHGQKLEWSNRARSWVTKSLPRPEALRSNKIDENTYYEAAKNYPAIDALFKLNDVFYGIQYTLQQKHDVNFEHLSQIVKGLSDRSKNMFRYVFIHNIAEDPYKPDKALDKTASNESVVDSAATFWACRYDLRELWRKFGLHQVESPREAVKKA